MNFNKYKNIKKLTDLTSKKSEYSLYLKKLITNKKKQSTYIVFSIQIEYTPPPTFFHAISKPPSSVFWFLDVDALFKIENPALLWLLDGKEFIITCSLLLLETTCVVVTIWLGAGLAGAWFLVVNSQGSHIFIQNTSWGCSQSEKLIHVNLA